MSLGAFKQTTINVGPTPVITGATGDIVSTFSTDLTLSVTELYSPTGAVDVLYYDGATLVATTTNQSISSGSVTTTVPSSVYGKSVGTNITIRVRNYPGGKESLTSATETVLGLPTGGSVTTAGNVRVHVFNSTADFVVPTGFSRTMTYVCIAGGAGGAGYRNGGGGGAGGMQETSSTIGAGTYGCTIGAGGTGGVSTYAARDTTGGNNTNGSNSSIAGIITSIGGGRGTHDRNGTYNHPAYSGGSGGAGGDAGGAGTSGQGSAGGSGGSDAGGGGGGKSQTGQAGSGLNGGDGGDGGATTITGSSVTRAGGGGGGYYSSFAGSIGIGGTGGGGNGGTGNENLSGMHGSANYGGGGGGAGWDGDWSVGQAAGNGGSGYIAIKYTV